MSALSIPFVVSIVFLFIFCLFILVSLSSSSESKDSMKINRRKLRHFYLLTFLFLIMAMGSHLYYENIVEYDPMALATVIIFTGMSAVAFYIVIYLKQKQI